MTATDAAAWLQEHATLAFDHQAFACLPGCGFCCTYPPQVSPTEWQAIHEDTGLTQVGIDPQGGRRLPLQGGCGGCVLLEDRGCTSYENRPRHCRLFPFHVYFGRHVEVYADRVCPGLDPAETSEALQPSPIPEALRLAARTVPPAELADHAEHAAAVHAEFERLAREADLWRDPDEARRRALADVTITPAAWEEALAAFEGDDLALVPTMVLPGPGFAWRLWHREDGVIRRLRFEEDGITETVGTVEVPERPTSLEGSALEVLERLVGLECFMGSAFDLVDASEYERPLDEAIDQLVSEVAAGLALRAPLLEAEGLPVDQRWLAAAYEPDFFDLPTIGGWL